jgi:membrane protease YdiL (CAAX protease family)
VKRRYSGRQLLVARCAIVVLFACLAGPGWANEPAEIPITILVVLALVGAAIGAYEALARGLAIVLSRLWDDTGATSRDPLIPDLPRPPSAGALRQRDVITALLIFLGAEALVWMVVGVVAALRVGRAGDHGALLQALTGLIPIALPGSLLAGGIALLLVLRRWRQMLGTAALANLLGLSWGGPRQISNGVLAGAALALLILPIMGLVADPAEPPDVMTQLASSSTAALRAWMLSAVLLAPPIEELMFRGVLLGGLTETWNLRTAAMISGVTFWLMHGPEFVHWPAAVAIALLTVLTTWLRVRNRSLGSSIGAHFGYNLVLATMVWLAMTYGPAKSRWAREHQLPSIEWIWGWTANAHW